jgi:hypothetical protein
MNSGSHAKASISRPLTMVVAHAPYSDNGDGDGDDDGNGDGDEDGIGPSTLQC